MEKREVEGEKCFRKKWKSMVNCVRGKVEVLLQTVKVENDGGGDGGFSRGGEGKAFCSEKQTTRRMRQKGEEEEEAGSFRM